MDKNSSTKRLVLLLNLRSAHSRGHSTHSRGLGTVQQAPAPDHQPTPNNHDGPAQPSPRALRPRYSQAGCLGASSLTRRLHFAFGAINQHWTMHTLIRRLHSANQCLLSNTGFGCVHTHSPGACTCNQGSPCNRQTRAHAHQALALCNKFIQSVTDNLECLLVAALAWHQVPAWGRSI